MKKKSTSQSAFFNLRILTASAFCLLGIAVALFAQGNRTRQTQASRSTAAQDAPGTQRPDVMQMVGPVMLTTNLKNLPYIPTEGEQEEQPLTRFPRGGGAPPPLPPSSPWLQSLIKGLFRPAPTMPGPLLTFEGMNLGKAGAVVSRLTATVMWVRITTSTQSIPLSKSSTKVAIPSMAPTAPHSTRSFLH